jgi:hypothetical protein
LRRRRGGGVAVQLRDGLGLEGALRSVATQAADGVAAGILRAVQGIKVKP